jgi:glycosyltransferase involved in cell wall biosynthesis
MTRVAVVIPCFDDGATLRDALASLAGQEEHELVVVDDGSTDPATLETLAAVKAEGVRVVRRENGGLSAARMTGVEHTSAPYVMPLDADDALGPGALAALADALDRAGDAVMAWGDAEVWGEIETRLTVGRQLDAWQISYLNTLPVASMVRRDALLAVGGWQLRYGYEDWDLWMAFAERRWHGVYVPAPVFRYRRRGGRMLGGCIPLHGELYAELQRRHPALFTMRRGAWLRSKAPLGARVFFPLIALLPMSDYDKSRLFQLANAPRQFLRMRRLRRRATVVAA